MMDIQSGAVQQVAQHDQAIRCARFVSVPGAAGDILATGSWDKTVKYWDLRQQAAVSTLTCQERVYTMDVKEQLLVIGTADRYINVVNLSQPDKFFKTLQSPLKWQTRVVTCFNDQKGFAVGSIEGRCAIQYVDEKDTRQVKMAAAL
jgi:mRNA export factor